MKSLEESLNLNENKFYQMTSNTVETAYNMTNKIFDGIIRGILPDSIEDNVINIKDALELNKLAQKVATVTETIFYKKGNFNDIINSLEIEKRTETIIKNVNELFNLKGTDISKIENSKDKINDKLKKELTDAVNKYVKSLNKNQEYMETWKHHYENKDIKNMEKEYKKIEKNMEKLLPIEKEINKIRKIENITTLIKEKGGDFNLTKEELELVNKLI